jgi:circadian clock protein KaiC
MSMTDAQNAQALDSIKKSFVLGDRSPTAPGLKKPEHEKMRSYIKTGVRGFDDLFEKGIPKRSNILLAGGAGSGKTLLGLQVLYNAARAGKKCFYMSFEESEDRLREHMEDFGWSSRDLEAKGNLMIKRFSIFDVGRSLDALHAKAKGELLIDIDPIIIPEGFQPDFIVVDSLTAIASAFAGHDTYRSYIESLFRYFESIGATSFLITETEQMPTVFSPTGVEEFLADGVIVLYNIRKNDIRENAIEILKMRGAKHLKKIVAMRVVPGSGIEVYPEQEIFSGIQ